MTDTADRDALHKFYREQEFLGLQFKDSGDRWVEVPPSVAELVWQAAIEYARIEKKIKE